MVRLELLEERDFQRIIEWNRGKSADFLYQWAGCGYDYPITEDKLKRRFAGGVNSAGSDTYIYKIVLLATGKMVGTIELAKIDRVKKFGVIARFLIGEEGYRGKGIGGEALRLLIDRAFAEFGLESLALKVFDFNSGAIKCYEKLGFIKGRYNENVRQTGGGSWGCYEMAVTKSAWENRDRKNERARRAAPETDNLVIIPASREDLEEILGLQRLAFMQQAELYGDFELPPLKETPEQLDSDFGKKAVFKAVLGGIIAGSVRAFLKDGTCFVERLAVHPDYQNLGLGAALMKTAEESFGGADRFELFTGCNSAKNLYLYEKLGYKAFKRAASGKGYDLVYMDKRR